MPDLIPKKGWKAYVIPVVAVMAMLMSMSLMFVLSLTSQSDAHRNCQTNLSFYNTFEKVIYAAGHPPTLAGRPVTKVQRDALEEYANNLRTALPEKPKC